MLKYLVIQLDDASVSYCHYHNDNKKHRLIELEVLKKVLLWSMAENLTVQLLYPDYELSEEYKCAISEIDHGDIVSSTCEDEELLKNADVVVFDSWASIEYFPIQSKQSYVIRTTFEDLFLNQAFLNTILPKASRINLVITDIHKLDSNIETRYFQFLENLNEKIFQEYKNNHGVQVNILTDRILLDSMNNCGAGDETITLAPNGKFYICPAFYLDNLKEVGDYTTGVEIKNSHLYKISYAPICRICDAYHCKRCIWQNKKSTMEVNTPGHEQCVMSHIEREASRRLLDRLRTLGSFLPEKEIKKLEYMDPFEVLKN